MNTVLLRRLPWLTVLPLWILLGGGATHAAEPASADAPGADAPAAAGAAPTTPDDSDWQDRSERPAHRTPKGHREHGNDLVNIGDDSVLRQGEKADSVVSIFGSSTSDGEADDVVSIFGNTRATGEVHDSAVSVFGNVYIDGKVDGDVVAVFGNLELGPHAEIAGNVVTVVGIVRRDPAAIVHGDVQDIIAGDLGGFGWLRTWIHHCLLYGRPLALAPGLGWAWGLAFAFLALYAVLALVFREGITQCAETFETHPGQSVLAALMAMLLTPVLVVLLFVTVVGIAAVPFVVFGLFCAGLFGKAAMLAWIGRRVTNARGSGAMSHPAVAVLIGGAIVLVLYLIPILGLLLYKLLGVLGLGAVVYTAILAARAHQAARQPLRPAAATAAAAAPGSPAAGSPAAGSPAAGSPAAASAAPASAAASPGISPSAEAAAAGTASIPEGAAAPGVTLPGTPAAHISAALPRAGFWIRMAALLLDGILVGFVLHVLHLSHMELLALAAYGAVMWKTRGSTIGGIVFDLRIVRLDGRAVDWETAIIRALSCFVSLVVAGLGFFWIAFDHDKQAWHDKIAGTVVVRVARGTPLV